MADNTEAKEGQEGSQPKSKESKDLENLLSDEIFEAIPEEDRKEVSKVVRQTLFSGVVKAPKNPIQDKITPEHIGQIIHVADKQDEREKKDRNWDRLYKFGIFFVSVIILLVIIYILKDDKEQLEKVITALIAFAAGAGAGFGVGRTHKE